MTSLPISYFLPSPVQKFIANCLQYSVVFTLGMWKNPFLRHARDIYVCQWNEWNFNLSTPWNNSYLGTPPSPPRVISFRAPNPSESAVATLLPLHSFLFLECFQSKRHNTLSNRFCQELIFFRLFFDPWGQPNFFLQGVSTELKDNTRPVSVELIKVRTRSVELPGIVDSRIPVMGNQSLETGGSL